MNQDFVEPIVNRDINYAKILGTLLSRWYWIAACVIITVSMGWLYLSVIHPRYSSTASLLLSEKKSDISQILSNPGEESKNTYESFNAIQSATFIIQSQPFLSKAVSRLNYRYSFYKKDIWSTEELYPETPFRIEIIKQDTSGFYSSLFSIKRSGKGKFELSYAESNDKPKVYSYGDIINAPGLVFRITSSFSDASQTYYFRFNTKQRLIDRAQFGLSVEGQPGNILSISHTDVNPYFSADILNAISKEYIIDDFYRHTLSATQRLKFITDQLDTLQKQVNISSTDLEKFKKINGLDNLNAKLQNDVQKLNALQMQKEQLSIERLGIERLQLQVAANDTKAMLNFNLEGPIGSLLATLVSQLNDGIKERDDKLTKYNVGSDPVMEVDRRIAATKVAIANNIRQAREGNEDKQRYLDIQIANSNATLEGLPSDAKDLINLQTDFTTKQKILATLTDEKYKSSIALSAIEPSASIIYAAAPSDFIVWPAPKRIYLTALMAGLAMGIFLILMARYFNRYIRDVGTVENLTDMPILGLIRKADKFSAAQKDYYFPLIDNPGSLFSESVRSLRNSVVFTLNETQGKIICISSEVSGEGRSFTTANLACALAQLEKKVVIVDADLRKPSDQINAEEAGLSAYLANFKTLPGVLKHTGVKNMDIITSGIIPPNPSELLQNPKMQELLGFLRNIYDYIIIDTSPVGVVSDAIPLIEAADINLFVLRSDKSKFNATSQMEKIAAEYRLNNFFVVLNAFRKNSLYQPFYSDTNTDIYFNKYYSDYVKKHNSDVNASKWKRFSGA